jgi:ferredoxin
MAFEIQIDRNLCMGSGQCVMAAPATFDLDSMSVAIVIDPDGDPAAAIFDAEDVCPTRAIKVLDRATGQPARTP